MMIKRPTNRYSLPEQAAAAKADIVHAVIFFGEGSAVDIGARCFSIRTEPQGGVQIAVDPSSYLPARPVFFGRLIDRSSHLAAEFSPLTLLTRLRAMMAWVGWADKELEYDCLKSEAETRRALLDYDFYLIGQSRLGKITPYSLMKKMDLLKGFLSEVYEVDNILADVPRRFYRRAQITSEVPPSRDEMEIALSLYYTIFHGLSDAVLNDRKFPFAIQVPARFKRENNLAYVFPTLKRFSFDEKGYLTGEAGKFIWNFSNGRVEDPEPTGRLRTDSNIREAKKRMAQVLEMANESGPNRYRLFFAGLAYRAAIQLFLANTGMNHAVLIKQKWGDEYEEVAVTQGFRGYKPRAGYAEVEFIIEAQFLPTFRKILQLRKYLLQGRESEFLFFSGNMALEGEFKKMPVEELHAALVFFEAIDPSYIRLGSKKLRVAKANDVLSNHGIRVAANAAQNKPSTLLQNYSGVNQERAEKEMSGFLKSIPVRIEERDKENALSGVGGCASYGNPSQTIKAGKIVSNCKQDEGCLFCERHLVHADETDIWKLLSCKFVVLECGAVHVSQAEFENVLSPVVARIDEILALIVGHDITLKARLESIQDRVFNEGELEPYWAAKMEIYQILS